MPAASALARAIAVTGAEKLTGAVAVDGGKALLYFMNGKPVHATCDLDGSRVAGERAVDAIVGTYGGSEEVAFNSAEVPAYTLQCTLEDLVNRLNASGGESAGAEPPARRPGLGERGHVPLLPRGRPLFDEIPLGAIVLEALAPALANGAIVAQREGALGVVLVRDGAIFETYCFDGSDRLLGAPAMARIRTLAGATVSAFQFSGEVVDLAPVLLRGDSIYEDLQLEWVDWTALLADLASRAGTFVVEVEAPTGSGVTCFHDGRHIGTYSDTHPELGDQDLLDSVVAARLGTVWVRRHGRALDELERDQGSAAPVTPPVVAPAPAAVVAPPAAAAPAPVAPRAEPANPFAAITPAADAPFPMETAFDDIFGAPADAAEDTAGGSDLAAMLDALKEIARGRLQRQAARVEAMLDDAVQQGIPAEQAVESLRTVSVRGVMPATMASVVDEMLAHVRGAG